MADTKTHDETTITPLVGTEEFYIVGSAGTVDGKTTISAASNFAFASPPALGSTTPNKATVTYVVTVAVALSSLPSAATAGVGARAFITDSTQTIIAGIGTTAVGGSTNKVPVYSDGTNWIIG